MTVSATPPMHVTVPVELDIALIASYVERVPQRAKASVVIGNS